MGRGRFLAAAALAATTLPAATTAAPARIKPHHRPVRELEEQGEFDAPVAGGFAGAGARAGAGAAVACDCPPWDGWEACDGGTAAGCALGAMTGSPARPWD